MTGSGMVPLRLIYLSEVKYLLRKGCRAEHGTAPCFLIEFRNNDMTLALQATGITKHFLGVLANDRVNFSLKRGEIHALLAENKTFYAFHCRTLLLRK